MDGINPLTNKVPKSALLSLCLTKGIAHLHLANVSLEGVILQESVGSTGSVDSVVDNLNISTERFAQGSKIISEQLGQVSEVYRTSDCVTTAEHMHDGNVVDVDSLNRIREIHRYGGLKECLEHIKGLLNSSLEAVDLLTCAVKDLNPVAVEGRVGETLEENHCLNIKLEFAEAFTATAKLQADYLAFSVYLSERGYQMSGFGSLFEKRLSLVA